MSISSSFGLTEAVNTCLESSSLTWLKKVIVSTHATFLEEDYMNNFKPKSKVVLEELDSVRDPPQTPIFPPLFPVDVQRGENVQNVPEGEQTQETAQDQIQETQ